MRYIIGIDLGTTNCCAAYVDTAQASQSIQPFRIPQLVAAGYVDALATLPSFCYLSSPYEWPKGVLELPWNKSNENIAGAFAQVQGSKVPTKLVASAKSWLCHSAAHRRDKILPFDSADDAQRLSPVEASARYLSHIKDAWNYQMAKGNPEAEFEMQEIVLTVPASFDEVARALTVEAARMAGYRQVTLLEEPQAAFYSWIAQHEQSWHSDLPPGSCVLVCDVGGGTTDFSLIEVASGDGGAPFQRMAVGDHLLLGGDNMDMTAAHYLEGKLRNQGFSECTPFQWLQLRYQARAAKEALVGTETAEFRIAIQGEGSSIVKNTLAVEISQDEMARLLMEGFFGFYSLSDALALQKTAGMRTMGLPYEDEPSITKHMAHFLSRYAGDKKPDFVLFNGGAMKPKVFRQAILRNLKAWYPDKNPKELNSFNLDLAVARGAAYYGKARRGCGIKVGGGAARGYYLAVATTDASQKALTLLPRGSEEGCSYQPEQIFWIQPNAPIAFQVYTSHVRLNDKQGDLVDIIPEEMHSLPAIRTILRFGKGLDAAKDKIPVRLCITLTALGTLELWLQSQRSEHRWSLEFQLRSAAGQEDSMALVDSGRRDETFDAEYLREARQAIATLFSGKGLKPGTIMDALEEILERPRREWFPSILRGLWEELLLQAPKRRNSPDLDARWWNMAGFFLRPGYGFPLDDFRMKELWKVILADLKAGRTESCQIQSWICYRRVAGGLNKGQQMQLAAELAPAWLAKKNAKIESKNKSGQYPMEERIRTLASMELVDMQLKVKWGEALVEKILSGNAAKADYWALGRIGARQLMYGTLPNVVPREVCARWMDRLLSLDADPGNLLFVIEQLARKTGHREINLPANVIEKAAARYPESSGCLLEEAPMSEEERDRAFGEAFPIGISIS